MAVQQLLDAPIGRMTRIIRGESHEVYDVTVGVDDTAYIVRISPQKTAHFDAERWAIRQVSRHHVPAPQSIRIGAYANTDHPIVIEAYPKIIGEAVDIWDPTFDRLSYKPHVLEAGALLRRIHSVPTLHYGPLDAMGIGAFPTFMDRIMSVMNQLGAFEPLLANQCTHVYQRAYALFRSAPSHLVHGDYAPKHFILHNGSVAGIIDWEGVESGPYYLDFGRWSHYYHEQLPIRWLLEGYGATEKEQMSIRTVLPYMELFWACHSLLFYSQHNYREQADEDTEKILTILHALS